jgi:O-methyltransferase domain
VQPHFDTYVQGFGLADRLRFFPGDFFPDPLPAADVDWDLATKRQLIAKVFEALPPGGAFLVHEAIIDDDRRQHAYGLLMSLTMLIDTHGGFDFTGSECTTWMREAGFKETRIEPLTNHDSMVVGIK